MLARGADLTALDDTETLVKYATGDRIVALMRLIRYDLDNRPPEDLLGRHDAKLNAYNRHCILISLSRNIFGDPFLPNISGLLNKRMAAADIFDKLWYSHLKAIDRQLDIIMASLKRNPGTQGATKEAILAKLAGVSIRNTNISMKPTDFITTVFGMTSDQLLEAADVANIRKLFETSSTDTQCGNAGKFGADTFRHVCYICNTPIHDGLNPPIQHSSRECEHILPAFAALGHGGLITSAILNDPNLIGDPRAQEIFKNEYSYAHQCCNQIKHDDLWIGYDPEKPGVKSLTPKVSAVQQTLTKIGRVLEAGSKSSYDCNVGSPSPKVGAAVPGRAMAIKNQYLLPLVRAISANMDQSAEACYAKYRFRQIQAIADILARKLLGRDIPAPRAPPKVSFSVVLNELHELILPGMLFNTLASVIDKQENNLDDLIPLVIEFSSEVLRRKISNRGSGSIRIIYETLLDRKAVYEACQSVVAGNQPDNFDYDTASKIISQGSEAISSELTRQLQALPRDVRSLAEVRNRLDSMRGGATWKTLSFEIVQKTLAETLLGQIEQSKADLASRGIAETGTNVFLAADPTDRAVIAEAAAERAKMDAIRMKDDELPTTNDPQTEDEERPPTVQIKRKGPAMTVSIVKRQKTAPAPATGFMGTIAPMIQAGGGDSMKGGFVLSPLGQKMLAEEPSKGVIFFYIVSHAKVELLSDASLYGFIYKATLNPGIPSPVYKHDFTTCACKDPNNLSCEPKSMKAPPNVLARPCFQEVRHFIFKISFLSKDSVIFSIYNRNGQPTRKRTDTVDGFRKESHIQYDLYDSKFLAGEPIIPPVLFREPLLRPLETSDGIDLVKQFPGLDAHVSAAVRAGATEVGMTMMQSAEGYKTLGEILADPTESLESKASSVAHARYAFYVLALEYGYSQGDSHTYNVMISDDIGQFASSTVPGNYSRGKVFIIDFGRARKIDFSQDPHTMTPTEVLYDVALEGLGQLAGQRDWLWNNAEDFLIHLPLGDVDNDIRAIAEKFAKRIDTISPAFTSNPNLKTFDPVQGAVHQYNELIPRTLAPMLDRGVAARVVGAPGAPALRYGKGRMTVSVKRRSRSKRNARIPRK